MTYCKGSTRFGSSLSENAKDLGSEMPCILKKLDDEVPKERQLFQLTYVVLCSLCWISWPLQLGLIGCPKTSVWNYHSTLGNISEERRSHMIW